MQKKRVTRKSTKEENPHFEEFKFSNNRPQKQQKLHKSQHEQKSKKQSVISQQFKNNLTNNSSQVHSNKNQQSHNESQPISKGIKQIKKKKVNKKEQNQGIRILQQKQTQRIFQLLCNPDGLITVQSIGRIMVRAKKEFQMEDLQNMIAYYDTIKTKLEVRKDQNVIKKVQNKQNKKQKANKMQLISQMQENQDSQQNFEDNLDQSDNQQFLKSNDQEEEKTQLNFQEFKIIKEYFQK